MTRKIRAKRKSKDLAHRSLWKMLAALSLCLCAPFANAAGEYEAALKLFRAADYKTARIELKNLLRDQPEHITGRILLGRTELRLSNPSAGEEQIQRALLDGAHPAIVEVPLAQADGRARVLRGPRQAAYGRLVLRNDGLPPNAAPM